MYSNNDINKIKDIILSVVQPEEIILFGSYVDDSYNDESDIDIMVLLQKELLRKEKLQYLRNLYLAFFKNNLEV
ncbi:MAG TPA: nucleotidyltransferase domain-containing protein, partial [Candidatus Cloacimonetes bacterium]|nr:nucleotidyltransferase domain-containing protein [Candidatus Cloacimonadota bacterium]